ncbi:hypothetical protein [Intrasporangium sp.]|uniref:hypothetical protein n=1 Tax=Intrasporangium sp. TaxID=1925024 RepID=UPI0032222090
MSTHQDTHRVYLTGSCPACGGPGSELTDGADETTCLWCAAAFPVLREQWWCPVCLWWLPAKPAQPSNRVAPAHQVTIGCGREDCPAVINQGRTFACRDHPTGSDCSWGCGGFYCILHLGEHDCPGFADLSMHTRAVLAGEPVCDWDGDLWPCAAVRAQPDNPTIGGGVGGAA